MVTLEWHPNALEDLKMIYKYIYRDSPYYAKLTIQTIRNLIKNLKSFPKMGRIVPELKIPEYRELIIQNYRILYQLTKTKIKILAILHSKQKFQI